MATFLECLYNAHSFTSKEKTRYDLDYVCCTQNAIYGTDGKKLYEGHPKDYPWKSISGIGMDDKGRTFFHALGMPKKPKDDDGYEVKDGKLCALGTDWITQSEVAFPKVDKILGVYDDCKYFPIDVNEWKRLVKTRAQLCDPESNSRKPPKIVVIEQADHKIIVKPDFSSDLTFTLTEKADQTAYTMKFNLDIWPWKCSPPLEVAMQEQTLLLRRGREKMILLGVKEEPLPPTTA